jgi:hypothetical protein
MAHRAILEHSVLPWGKYKGVKTIQEKKRAGKYNKCLLSQKN